MKNIYIVWLSDCIDTVYDNLEAALNRGMYLIDNSFNTNKFSKREKQEMKQELFKFWDCDYVSIVEYDLREK